MKKIEAIIKPYKMDDVTDALGLPTFWVRFNPDAPAALYGGTQVKTYQVLREAFDEAVKQSKCIVEGADPRRLTTAPHVHRFFAPLLSAAGCAGVKHGFFTLSHILLHALLCVLNLVPYFRLSGLGLLSTLTA